jgi:hypothetical protein
MYQRRVNTFWKPILWFTKGKYRGAWIADVVSSVINGSDKRFHRWGQSESGMRDLMKRFVRPGEMVIDPFMGAASTGIIALELKARFIGYEIDAKAFRRASRCERAKRRGLLVGSPRSMGRILRRGLLPLTSLG